MRIIINLSDEAINKLLRPISGSGGWQSLLRRLQQNLRGNELILNINDIERIVRYANNYGQGGFEDRLLLVIEEVIILVNTILDSLGYEEIEI